MEEFQDISYFLKASERLSKLDFRFIFDGVNVEVLWFRVMDKLGEWVIKRHNHSSFELHIIKAGSCRVVLDDREFTVSAGEYYLTTPGLYHEQISKDGGTFIEFCINFDIEVIGEADTEAFEILRKLSHQHCIAIKDKEGLQDLFFSSLKEAEEQKFGYFSNIKNLISIMIIKLAREDQNGSIVNHTVPVKYRTDEYRLKLIRGYIEDNCTNNISTQEVAAHLNLSEKQIARIVKKQLGITTKQLIDSIRLKKAKELLRDHNLTVKQVAYSMGFSSEYYFNQFFKNQEGYPPGQFNRNF